MQQHRYIITYKFKLTVVYNMGIEENLANCEKCADIVEAEMPEFAKVLREAVAHIHSWDD